jgi:hypothetical protein
LSDNGVTIIGFTDFPSRMAAQSSELYSTNVRHMLSDLSPEKDGQINHDMNDDVIRGATICYDGEITFPPPAPKVRAIATQKIKPVEKTKEELETEKATALANLCINFWICVDAFDWCVCSNKFHATFYCFCVKLFCWVSSYLECQSLTSYSINGRYKCNIRNHYIRCIATNGFKQYHYNHTCFD